MRCKTVYVIEQMILGSLKWSRMRTMGIAAFRFIGWPWHDGLVGLLACQVCMQYQARDGRETGEKREGQANGSQELEVTAAFVTFCDHFHVISGLLIPFLSFSHDQEACPSAFLSFLADGLTPCELHGLGPHVGRPGHNGSGCGSQGLWNRFPDPASLIP